MPKVTILMPVYNGERYLREAVDSMLGQTFQDFEFIIINDGSTDGTSQILSSYDDPRIIIINQGNVGLSKSLNRGFKMARGAYIARMDCDDISLPQRLEKQVALMEREPLTGVCGTWIKTIGDNGRSVWNYPAASEEIRCRMIFESVIAHPSAVIRRSFFEKYNLYYDENLNQAQDYALWVKCASLFDLKNISEVLLMYRIHPDQVGRIYSEGQKEAANSIRKEQLKNLGLKPDEYEFNLHERISCYNFGTDRKFVEAANLWLMKLMNANSKVGCYPELALEHVLAQWWYLACDSAADLGMWAWNTFWHSPLSETADLNILQKTIFLMKCLMKHESIKSNLRYFFHKG
ncbi:MAG: glycosyltransferase family 2 protein [bacterium]|nr:glycosyltransferase family 2 protein [bacterium]